MLIHLTMKKNFRLTFLMAGIVSFVLFSCDKEENDNELNGDDNASVKNCMISQINFLMETICDDDNHSDNSEEMFSSSLNYDSNDRLISWIWDNTSLDSYYFEYNQEGNISKVSHENENNSSYAILEWNNNKVTRQFIYDDNVISSQKYVFEFGSEEKEETISIYSQNDGIWNKTSYYKFYWDNDNVDKIERYRFDDDINDFQLMRTINYEYDDKLNPFYLQKAFRLGMWESAEDNSLFYSKNNALVMRRISPGGSERKFEFDYEYNDSEFISKWSITQSYDNNCVFIQTYEIMYENCD